MWFLVVAAGVLLGCAGGVVGSKPQGHAGGEVGGSAGNGDDKADCADGTEGCTCHGNGTCDARLRCEDDRCRECPAGDKGCPCYGNDTCNANLECRSDSCVALAAGGAGSGSGGEAGSEVAGGRSEAGASNPGAGGAGRGGAGGATTGGTGAGGTAGGDAPTEQGGAAGDGGREQAGAAALGGAAEAGATSSGGTLGTGGGGGDSMTTLDGATTLSALTQDEAAQLCDDSYAYFYFTGITPETVCKWKGLAYATSSSAPTQEKLRQNCTKTEDSCLADPAVVVAGNPGCSSLPSGCSTTVAEYSACIKDLASSFTITVGAIEQCSVLTNGDTGTGAVWVAQTASAPPTCRFPTCPDLYPPSPLF
jgi:hypothetical protein